jgi:hypothetical protein
LLTDPPEDDDRVRVLVGVRLVLPTKVSCLVSWRLLLAETIPWPALLRRSYFDGCSSSSVPREVPGVILRGIADCRKSVVERN